MAEHLISCDQLMALVERIFSAVGCAPAEAGRIARYLVNANLTGHDSHGVVRVPRYIGWVRDGTLVANQSPAVVSESESHALLDGRHGFGQSIGPEAVRLGIAKAAAQGVSIIALKHSGHLGRIGEWAEMAAAAGQVSLHFVNVAGSLIVAPFGGVERRMSTNPLAIGVPMGERPPLILDFASSVVAEGKVLVAYNGGKPLPEGSLIAPDGRLANDPEVFYGPHQASATADPRAGRGTNQGAIRAMGEHKGSGLSFMMEMLAGALTGSGCAGPGARQVANGMLSVYLTPQSFGSAEAFAGEVRGYVEFFKSARPAEADGEILVPGEPERRTRARRLAEGVPLPDTIWRAILDAARDLDVMPEGTAGA